MAVSAGSLTDSAVTPSGSPSMATVTSDFPPPVRITTICSLADPLAARVSPA